MAQKHERIAADQLTAMGYVEQPRKSGHQARIFRHPSGARMHVLCSPGKRETAKVIEDKARRAIRRAQAA